ncbi:MAG: hypothetical protein ACYC3X_31735 [Pirellulaceae bacterium]
MLSESDRKFAEWMRKQIAAYETSALGLGSLITDLESLVGTMESLSPQHRRDFIDYWGGLEVVYAVFLDREIHELDSIGRKIVNEAIGNLKQWIETVEREP